MELAEELTSARMFEQINQDWITQNAKQLEDSMEFVIADSLMMTEDIDSTKDKLRKQI